MSNFQTDMSSMRASTGAAAPYGGYTPQQYTSAPNANLNFGQPSGSGVGSGVLASPPGAPSVPPSGSPVQPKPEAKPKPVIPTPGGDPLMERLMQIQAMMGMAQNHNEYSSLYEIYLQLVNQIRDREQRANDEARRAEHAQSAARQAAAAKALQDKYAAEKAARAAATPAAPVGAPATQTPTASAPTPPPVAPATDEGPTEDPTANNPARERVDAPPAAAPAPTPPAPAPVATPKPAPAPVAAAAPSQPVIDPKTGLPPLNENGVPMFNGTPEQQAQQIQMWRDQRDKERAATSSSSAQSLAAIEAKRQQERAKIEADRRANQALIEQYNTERANGGPASNMSFEVWRQQPIGDRIAADLAARAAKSPSRDTLADDVFLNFLGIPSLMHAMGYSSYDPMTGVLNALPDAGTDTRTNEDRGVRSAPPQPAAPPVAEAPKQPTETGSRSPRAAATRQAMWESTPPSMKQIAIAQWKEQIDRAIQSGNMTPEQGRQMMERVVATGSPEA